MRALVLAALVACSKQESAPDSGPIDAGPESFASQYAHAVCDSIGDCCAQNHFKLDRSNCVAVVEGEEQLRVNGAAASGLSIDSGTVERCLAEARATFQACPTSDWKTAQAKLQRACHVWSLPGNKPIGASCTDSTECATNTGCDFVDCSETCICHHEAGPGSCASKTSDVLDCPRAIDEDYTFFNVFTHAQNVYPTSEKWYCDIFNDAGPTCTPTDPLGTPCDPSTAIGSYVPSCGGATCDKTTKTCTRAPIGAPCGRTIDTYCVDGAFCDYPSYTCQVQHKTGEPCGGEFPAASCTGNFCDYDVPAPKNAVGQCLTSPFAPFYVCGALP
jgi:hypothetical protein